MKSSLSRITSRLKRQGIAIGGMADLHRIADSLTRYFMGDKKRALRDLAHYDAGFGFNEKSATDYNSMYQQVFSNFDTLLKNMGHSFQRSHASVTVTGEGGIEVIPQWDSDGEHGDAYRDEGPNPNPDQGDHVQGAVTVTASWISLERTVKDEFIQNDISYATFFKHLRYTGKYNIATHSGWIDLGSGDAKINFALGSNNTSFHMAVNQPAERHFGFIFRTDAHAMDFVVKMRHAFDTGSKHDS